MRFGDDGRLYAINPEAGFFGVAPGTGDATNPNAIADAVRERHLHQRGADRRRRRLVGGPDRRRRPHGLTDWKGRHWTPASAEPAAHPNARFTAPASPVPDHRARVGGPRRRADLGHPVRRSPRQRPCRWSPRRSTGRTASSWRPTSPPKAPPRPRTRSASCAAIPSPCCRSAATTWATTSATGSTLAQGARPGQAAAHLLRQLVPQGRARQVHLARLWREQPRAEVDRPAPGGQGAARETPIGRLPAQGALDVEGLDLGEAEAVLLCVDREAWLEEAARIPEFYASSAIGCRRS